MLFPVRFVQRYCKMNTIQNKSKVIFDYFPAIHFFPLEISTLLSLA